MADQSELGRPPIRLIRPLISEILDPPPNKADDRMFRELQRSTWSVATRQLLCVPQPMQPPV